MAGFFDRTGPLRTVTHGEATFDLPIRYFRDDAFALFTTADAAALQALLPSPNLRLIKVSPRRAVLAVAAFNYIDTSIGPYGEVAIVVPVVHGRRPLPLLPLLRESRYRGFGSLVMHLPVTHRVARDAGRGEWGYTKFVADMRFESTPEYHECRLAEGGHHILTLRVAKRGAIKRDPRALVTYSVRGGDLIRTEIPQKAVLRSRLRCRESFLELGDHPVAASIRELRPAERPLMTRTYLERSAILPSGQVVESGVGALDGYRGADADAGEHRVRYPEPVADP